MALFLRHQTSPHTQASRRLRLLVGALLVCAVVWPITRWVLLRKPAAPPASAGVETQRRYWRDRIQSNVADVEAFTRLGLLEERAGFYMAAVKYLRAARALGVPDARTCGPLGRALTQLARDDEALPELENAVRLAPDSLDAAANLAGLYVTQNAPEMAASVLNRFLKAHQPIQTSSEARRLALAFLECGDNKAARATAERALELAPKDMIARSVAARCALGAKDFSAARRHLTAMLEQAPNDPGTLYLHGTVLEAQGDLDGALKQWQKAVLFNENALDAYERIGNVYARRGDMRRAARAYENIAQRAPSTGSALRAAAALTRAGNEARATYWKAIAAGFTGDFALALRLGKTVAANPATRRLGLQVIAEAYRGMNRKQPYIATMKQITAGNSVDDLVVMARAWGEADEPVKRTEYLQRALAKAPPERQSALYLEQATTYHLRGMRDEAERALEQARQKSPRDDPRMHRQLASLYYERRSVGDRLKQAIGEWEAAIALDPDDETDWQQLGRAYQTAGRTARAIQCLEHAVDLEPGYGPAYLELGRAYASLGDKVSSKHMLSLYAKFVAYDQQRQTLRTRARRERASPDDLIAYGDFMRKSGNSSEAASHYQKALSLRPKDSRLRAKLSALYGRLGRTDLQARL